MINNTKKIKSLGIFIFFIIYFLPLGDGIFAENDRVPKGKPFQITQKQIDELYFKLELLFGQSCVQGEFVAGIDIDGNVICRGPRPADDIVAYGMGLENHLARSSLKITSENLPQTEYIMSCEKSDNDTGPIGTDPFDSEHANFMLEFGPQLIGSALDAIAVEIFDTGNSNASVQLKSVDDGVVLAGSDEVSTSSPGWIEFSFSNFIIEERQILVNFVTSNDARIYNCAYKVEFIPH